MRSRQSKYRDKLKEHGICVDCGKEPVETDRVRCHPCLDKNNAATRKRAKMLRKAKKCVVCARVPARKGKRMCQECAARTTLNQLRRREKQRELH